MPPRKRSTKLSPKAEACVAKCMKSRKSRSPRKSSPRKSRKSRKSSPRKSRSPAGSPGLNKAYCVKCKAKNRKMNDIDLLSAKNGKPMLCGVCGVCGTKMCKFIGEKDLAAAERLVQ